MRDSENTALNYILVILASMLGAVIGLSTLLFTGWYDDESVDKEKASTGTTSVTTTSTTETTMIVTEKTGTYNLSKIDFSKGTKRDGIKLGYLDIPKDWVVLKDEDNSVSFLAQDKENELTSIDIYEVESKSDEHVNDVDVIAYMINSLSSMGVYSESDALSKFCEQYNNSDSVKLEDVDLDALKVQVLDINGTKVYHIGTSTGCNNTVILNSFTQDTDAETTDKVEETTTQRSTETTVKITDSSKETTEASKETETTETTGTSDVEETTEEVKLNFETFVAVVKDKESKNTQYVCIDCVCQNDKNEYDKLLKIINTYKIGE
jgi:hypothetical protein